MLFHTLVVILCVALNSANAIENEPETAVDIITKSGLHITFPFYGQIRQMNPDLERVTTEHTILTIRYLQEIVGGSLQGKRLGTFGWVGVSTKLISMGRAAKAARKDMQKNVGSNGQFNKDMRDMFKRMMELSKKEEVNLTPEDSLKLKADMDVVFDGLVEALEASPVSQYYDWSNGTIDGLPFETYVSKMMARLSKNGFSGIFGCIDTLLTWFVRLSSLG